MGVVTCQLKINSLYTFYVVEAVKGQHLEIVDMLSKAGCDVNTAENDYNYAPIHVAVREGMISEFSFTMYCLQLKLQILPGYLYIQNYCR